MARDFGMTDSLEQMSFLSELTVQEIMDLVPVSAVLASTVQRLASVRKPFLLRQRTAELSAISSNPADTSVVIPTPNSKPIPDVIRSGWSFDGSACPALTAGGFPHTIAHWILGFQNMCAATATVDACPHVRARWAQACILEPLKTELDRRLTNLRLAQGTRIHFENHVIPALYACAPLGIQHTLLQHVVAARRRPRETLAAYFDRWSFSLSSAQLFGVQISDDHLFWTLFHQLSTLERSAFSARPGVEDLLILPFGDAAAPARASASTALLAQLQSFMQSPAFKDSVPDATRDAYGAREAPSAAARPSAPHSPRTGAPAPTTSAHRRRRNSRGHPPGRAAVAEALASDSSRSSDAESLPPPTPSAAALSGSAARASSSGPGSVPLPRTFCYTGDRAADERETRRRRAAGLCLRCLPSQCPDGQPHAFATCPHHSRGVRAPREGVAAYRD